MGIFETKNKFSEVCEQVSSSGEPVLVTKRGKALVRIMPLTTYPSAAEHDHGKGGRSVIWNLVREHRAQYGPVEEEIEFPERTEQNRDPWWESEAFDEDKTDK